jgi:hypothetical protein
MTMTANVTQADIHEGVRNDPCKCPIARSLKRKYKLKVEVFWNYIQITRRGTTTLYRHTDESRIFIKDFDARYVVEPFSFDLEEIKQ